MTKKRISSDPPLSAIKNRHELVSIWSALDGDLRSLRTRLNLGIATDLEMTVAAHVNNPENKLRRRGSSDRRLLLQMAQRVAFLEKVHPTAPRKAVISKVAEYFVVSSRLVYEALKEFDSHALAEIKRITKAKVNMRPLDRDTLQRIVENGLARK
jgi:hypothetical protein